MGFYPEGLLYYIQNKTLLQRRKEKMKHTIKLLTLAFTLAAILTLTGCPGPVTPDMPCTHEHIWEEIITDKTKAATCTENGIAVYKCSLCGVTKTENSTALGHDYQGGYCETCEKYKFENRFIVRVYTSKDEFIKDISTYSVGLSSNNENNSPYDECKFSFESENPSMTVDTLIHKKLRYLNYNVVGYKVKEQDTPISIMECEEIFEESINRIYSILVEPQIN